MKLKIPFEIYPLIKDLMLTFLQNSPILNPLHNPWDSYKTPSFNLHLYFWKSMSWEIKVCCKPFQILHTWIFFQFVTWIFSGLWQKSSFLLFALRWRHRKKSRFAGPEMFLRFEADLDFSRPWFSEIKVQIKRPNEWNFFHSEFCSIWNV